MGSPPPPSSHFRRISTSRDGTGRPLGHVVSDRPCRPSYVTGRCHHVPCSAWGSRPSPSPRRGRFTTRSIHGSRPPSAETCRGLAWSWWQAGLSPRTWLFGHSVFRACRSRHRRCHSARPLWTGGGAGSFASWGTCRSWWGGRGRSSRGPLSPSIYVGNNQTRGPSSSRGRSSSKGRVLVGCSARFVDEGPVGIRRRWHSRRQL